MRLMYDSVNPAAIPADAAMVAGYIDSIHYTWASEEWARFSNTVKVRIATQSSTNDGHVLDVELGDATPVEAVAWVQMRRAAGTDPTVYTSLSEWASVRSAFAAATVREPHYWIAHDDESSSIPDGAIAKQYADPSSSGGDYDISAVADYWPGVDTQEVQVEQTDIALGYDGQPAKDAKGSQFTVAAELFGTNQAAWQCVALLQALATTVGTIATAVNADKTELDHIQQVIAALPEPQAGSFTFTGSGTVGAPAPTPTS